MNYSFAQAIELMTDGKAAKRPSWGGYVKRVDSASVTGAYDLVFTKRDGTTATYSVSAAGVITTSAALTLDTDLFAGMIAQDWTVGDTTAYEAARSGSGIW